MTKQIIIYILFAACFLSACRSDYYDSEPMNDATKDELTLTVRASDIVVSDGIASRADDQGPSTVFKVVDDDCVGLIVIDNNGRLLADNVPYKFDGKNWHFDADNEEGKKRVYYDATMSTYIVYYPYHSSANGVSNEDALKELEIFTVRDNQKDEENYRFSDLMVWTSEGEAKKDLDVVLEHVRNSFSLDIKLNWELPSLPSDNHLEYRPLREALIDFRVRLNDKEILNDEFDYTFHAEDGTQRYILPEDFTKGKITWRYTYRGESFGGESDVSDEKTGVRYVQHTIADISPEKAEPYDYFSYKKIGDKNYGFVMPWDAAECFETYNPIGIVFYVGQHSRDNSDYTGSGIGQKECHGYVVALADAFLPDAADPTKIIYTLPWANPVNNNIPNVTENTDTRDWSGYENLIKIRNHTNSKVVDGSIFPAEHACETYIGPDTKKGAPLNTSGWFLPTSNMLSYIMTDKKFEESFGPVARYADITLAETPQGKKLFEVFEDGYWSSTENELSDKETEDIIKTDENGRPIQATDEDGKLKWQFGEPVWEILPDTVRVLYERHYAYFIKINNNSPSTSAISKLNAKYVRPVLAF